MTDQIYRFFLQAIDPDHGCPVLEASFSVDDIEELRSLMQLDQADDGKLAGCYDIKPPEMQAITKRFNVAFEPGNRQVRIESWHPIRRAPYLIPPIMS